MYRDGFHAVKDPAHPKLKMETGMDIRETNKIADEAAEVGTVVQPSLTSRRITTGNQFTQFVPGGHIQPAYATTPQVSHKIAFESAGGIFTVLELLSALARIPNAGKTSAVEIMSWYQYHNVGDDSPSKDAQVAVVEWVE